MALSSSSSLIASLRAKSLTNLSKTSISALSNASNKFSLPTIENDHKDASPRERYVPNTPYSREHYIPMAPLARERYNSSTTSIHEQFLSNREGQDGNIFESYNPSGNIDWTSIMDNSSLNPITLNALELRNSLVSIGDSQIPDTSDAMNTNASKKMNNLKKAYGSLPVTGNTLLDKAKGIAKRITSLYEGGEVTGNFDGQGMSVGYLQWNMGSGTLQPLLKEMANSSATQAEFNEIFKDTVYIKDKNGNKTKMTMADALRNVLGKSKSEQLTFARSLNDHKNRIVEPWKSAFNSLIKNTKFIQIEDKHAKPYLNTASNIINNSDFGVKTVRGYALAFDIAVQNGSIKSSAKTLIQDALAGKSNKLTNYNNESLSRNQKVVIKDLNERLKGETDPELKKLYYTAAAVAISSNDRFVKDVWARKSAIIAGTGKVHGSNFNFNDSVGLSDNAVV
ncbi:MAG: hypothetical protein CVU84_09730 [Firmicutes bacterium HGW-Firmicutes-1]|jgi:hypothetical protein|nr:MAG: hypothetical protein CVU84_09730 [Firmicutes bacterium HGW-Firmicutes-1]